MAGRIPDSFIKDLVARSDIVEVIGSRLELKRAGKEFRALSPFTSEKTPSFYVNPAKQMFFDFSSGKNGTVITFLMEYDRLSFVEAVEELARIAGLEVPREGGTAEKIVLDGPLDALAAAERIYKTELRKQQAAIDYLKKRGVTGETAKGFALGFAPDAWDTLARQFPQPEHAITAGLLIPKDSGRGSYDRFRNRVMFPIRDGRGRVIAFGGRTLGNDPAKYLNSPETPLFHKGRNLYGLYEARQSGELPYVLVVEGYMDCVMLHQHGLRNTVATLGTATTREHLNLLFKSTRRVVFCFDGDRAGRAAAWRALEQALPELNETRECAFMFLPEGEDPDTLVQKIGADEFRRRAAAATPMLEYVLEGLQRRVDVGSFAGRMRLVSEVRPYLGQMRDGPLRAGFIDRLCRLSRLSKDDFLKALARELEAPPDLRLVDVATAAAARPVVSALRLLLERPDLADAAPTADALAGADVPGLPLLLDALDYFRANPEAAAGHWLERWRDRPEWPAVNQIASGRVEMAGEALEREFSDAMNHLSRRGLRARAEQLLQEARRRELSPEEQQELAGLSRQLAEPRPV